MIQEIEFQFGDKNQNNKSFTWSYFINKEHDLEIIKDKYKLIKEDVAAFNTENYANKIKEECIRDEDIKKIDAHIKQDKKCFFIKIISDRINKEALIEKRSKELDSSSKNLGKCEFILL